MGFIQPGLAGNGNGSGMALADGMLKMMGAMGMLSQTQPSWQQFQPNQWQWGNPALSSMPNPTTAAPWHFPYSPQDFIGEHNRPLSATAPQARLEGLWQGSGGERLWMSNGSFMLQADQGRKISGRMKLQPPYLLMQANQSQSPMLFEYAQHQGRLALRSADGTLYLYRRIESTPKTLPGPPAVREQ